MSASAEILWFNGIVVVASTGNKLLDGFYNTTKAAPAQDPFLIVVGAMDEINMSRIRDNVPGAYSAYDITGEGFARPNLMASGSGTSMAAPMVTGAIALLLLDWQLWYLLFLNFHLDSYC